MLAILMPLSFHSVLAESLLPQPTGQYSVGYHDYHWITASCPGPFYSNETAKDYSIQAQQAGYCREMMVRIYYPSNQPKTLGAAYDPAMIAGYKNLLQQFLPDIPHNILATLDQVRTWDQMDAPLATSGSPYPIIIFSPGYGMDESDYTVLVNTLVSQGYIVVALNNTFISYSVTFPDGPTVNNDGNPDERTILASKIDIRFVLDQLTALHQSNDIFQAMDLNKIGVMGHSLGADMAMYLGHENPERQIKAVVALDPYDKPQLNESLSYQFDIPFMVMHADTWFCHDQHSVDPVVLNADSYFIVLTHFEHMNFSNLAAFPQQTAFSYALTRSPALYNATYSPQANTLGMIDGIYGLAIQQAYVSQFFNNYLKGQALGWLQNALPHFPNVSGYYIGPTKAPLPDNWPGAASCQ